MANRLQIPQEAFADPVKLGHAINDALKTLSERLDKTPNRTRLSLDIQTPAAVVDAFPQIIANPGFNVGGLLVTRVANIDSPTTALSGGVTVQWQKTTAGNIAITHITGLSVNTRYTIELEAIDAA